MDALAELNEWRDYVGTHSGLKRFDEMIAAGADPEQAFYYILRTPADYDTLEDLVADGRPDAKPVRIHHVESAFGTGQVNGLARNYHAAVMSNPVQPLLPLPKRGKVEVTRAGSTVAIKKDDSATLTR